MQAELRSKLGRGGRNAGAKARAFGAMLAVVAALAPAAGHAQRQISHTEAPMLLVASPALTDPHYHQTVVAVTPVGEGFHVGVIINRPTKMALAALFPDHGPSKQVTEPVFSGGPMGNNALIAAIVAPNVPGRGAKQVAENLFMTADATVIDAVIERAPNSARYFVGHIIWREGELAAELAQRMWRVAPMDARTMLRKDAEQLWEELWLRANMLMAGVTTATTRSIQ